MKYINWILLGLLIAALPLFFTTIVWLLTFCSFDLICVVREDEIYSGFTIMLTIIGVITAILGCGYAKDCEK